MRIQLTPAIIAAWLVTTTFGFTNNIQQVTKTTPLFEKSKSLEISDYLVKAHEDKLRAVKEVENSKNAEIASLKQEVEKLKASSSSSSAIVQPSVPPSLALDDPSITKEELVAKLISYQQFMAKYIVESHQQKVSAVSQAEKAITAKYETKLQQLLSSAGASSTNIIDAPTAAATTESSLFMERNAKVAQAAQAGKSRWGDLENQRAASQSTTGTVNVTPPPPPPIEASVVVNGAAVVASPVSPKTEIPSEVGLRRSGFSLKDRVNLGSQIMTSSESSAVNGAVSKPKETIVGVSTGSTPTPASSLYQGRSDKVQAAAKAGKSRWGDQEVKRIQNEKLVPIKPAATTSPPRVEAPAEVGLRRGNFSLSDRINLGANLLKATPETNSALATPTASSSLFAQRNAKIVAAAYAGKSRWGDLEIQRAREANTDEASSSSTLDTGAGTTSTSLYQQRNLKVLASAVAGKSRWGSKEVERIQQDPAAVLPAKNVSSETIAAADHGIRYGRGPSLADRVNLGAQMLQ